MSEKQEFKASARVRVTVEVLNLGPYGADWKAGDIHDQVAREAQQKVQHLFGMCCKCGKEGEAMSDQRTKARLAVSEFQSASRANKAKDTTDSDIEEMNNLRRRLGLVTP